MSVQVSYCIHSYCFAANSHNSSSYDHVTYEVTPHALPSPAPGSFFVLSVWTQLIQVSQICDMTPLFFFFD